MHKKIVFSTDAISSIQNYIKRYGFYYQDLYEDSGLWNEETIISWYQNEARNRYFEIITTIESTLSNNIIVYLDNTAIIKWRSKVIQVVFKGQWNKKIIESVRIS